MKKTVLILHQLHTLWICVGVRGSERFGALGASERDAIVKLLSQSGDALEIPVDVVISARAGSHDRSLAEYSNQLGVPVLTMLEYLDFVSRTRRASSCHLERE